MHLAGLNWCPLKYQNIGNWTGTKSAVIVILWGLRGRDRTHHNNRKCDENPFFLSGSVIGFSIVEITLLSSTKQNIQVKNILEKILYNKTVIAFNWKPFRVTWVNPRFFMGFVLIIVFYFCVSLFFFICSFLLVIQFLHHAQTKQHNIIQKYFIQLSKMFRKR